MTPDERLLHRSDRGRLRTILPLALFLASFLALPGLSSAAPLVVLLHPSRGDIKVTSQDVSAIFLGRKTFWPGQKRIQPILPPYSSQADRDRFVKILHKNPRQFDAEWSKMVFRGDATLAPSRQIDEASAVRAVATNDKAIAVIDWAKFQALSQSARDSVRVTPVDDKKPDDPGYPLP